MADIAESNRFPRQPPATVSVVIPVRNGADLLPRQLACLEAQDYENDWELIVVDNGSTDSTAQVAAMWSDRLTLSVISAFDKPGVSYARNVGVRSARGDLIVFCDADDEVSEGWLRAIVKASLDSDAVGGATDLTRLNDPVVSSWNSLTMAEDARLAGRFLPAVGGGNFSIWSDVLTALDGFNENYGYGPEDVDLCWRLQLVGYRLGFSPQALIHIRSRGDLRSLARQFYGLGRGSPRLYRDFRSEGMPRSSIRSVLKGWAWLLIHLPDLLRDHSRRGNWVRAAATRAGKVVGTIENRTFYL